jgi:energy-coupling factor transport system ATP-binding protein
LTSSSTVAELAKKIGMVFDDPQTQLLTAGVYDELAFGLENLLVDPDEIRERISRVLKTCGLEEYRDKPPSILSGGQKQRLAIASALIMANRVLVLDEPSSQLDSSGTAEVLSLIRDSCVKNGLTVLMATGSGEEAVEFADRICVLRNGYVAAFDSPRHIFADQKLMDYVQAPQVSDFARRMSTLGSPLPDFPVNTEEAVASVLKWYDGGKKISHKGTKFTKEDTKEEKGGGGGDAIRIDRVSYSYNADKIILDNIDITIKDNEFVAIAGQNGSGKTTLLKLLCGLLRPSKGKYFLKGNDAFNMTIADIAGEIGFVMQEIDSQLFEPSVYDEVAFSLKHAVKKMPENMIREKTEESLAVVGLQDKRDEFPPALGRADRVKTVFSAVLAMGPKIIILDEPTAGHDMRSCRLIMEVAAKLHEQGYTIILVSHNMRIVAEYAQRLIVLQSSGVLMDGPPREIFNRTPELAKAGLKTPQITSLSQSLCEFIPLTQDALSPQELAEMLVNLK